MIANGNLVLESTGPTLAITGNGGIYVDKNTISGSPYINTTGVTNGTGTAYPSGAPEFIPGFSGVRVTRHLLHIFHNGQPSHSGDSKTLEVSDDFNLTNRNPWFSSFLVSSNYYSNTWHRYQNVLH
jgi:hypothetical protein